MPDEDAVAWIDTPHRAPVLDSAGARIGITESLLGDEGADIFHGLAVRLDHGHAIVEIPADQVMRITASAVHTSVEPQGVGALQPYHEQRWAHLGWGGLFRKRPTWVDS